MKDRALRAELEMRRDTTLRHAAERFLADERTDVGDQLKTLEAYNKLLAAMPNRRTGVLLTMVVIALICATAIGIASTIRIGTTHIRLSLQADAVGLALDQAWSWQDRPITSERFQVAQMTSLDLPSANFEAKQLTGRAWAEITGGELALAKLYLGPGGVLQIEQGLNGRIEIYANQAEFSGELSVGGKAKLASGMGSADITAEPPQQLDFTIPETVDFLANGQSGTPARMEFVPKASVRLTGLRVKALRFYTDVPDHPGGLIFDSTIIGGTLSLTELNRNEDVRKGDHLTLEGAQGLITELTIDDKIGVKFEGGARTIKLGPAGYQRDVTPTLSAYLYKNEGVKLVWGALVLSWGLLWGLWKTLLG